MGDFTDGNAGSLGYDGTKPVRDSGETILAARSRLMVRLGKLMATSPTDDLLHSVRTEFRHLPLRELLRSPTRVLLGISQDAAAAGKMIDELRFLPIDLMQSVPPAEAPAVAAVLDAPTVRDLALYPPTPSGGESNRSGPVPTAGRQPQGDFRLLDLGAHHL